MRRLCMFGDEAGDMTFAPPSQGITKYFYIATAVFDDHGAVARDLQELRHDLAKAGTHRPNGFHASDDKPAIRHEVLSVLKEHSFIADVTLFEKAKANPALRRTLPDFYSSAWYWHLKQVLPARIGNAPELLIVAGDINTKAKRQAYHDGLTEAIKHVAPKVPCGSAFWPASTDLCIQAVDYCGWAVMRKHESGDDSYYQRIKGSIGREYDLFGRGSTRYF